MTGILSRFPDVSAVAQLGVSVNNGLLSFNGSMSALASGRAGSPLDSLVNVMGGLRGHLSIDTSGLTQQLPQALSTMQNAVPAAGVDAVRSIQSAYTSAQGFLQNNEWVQFAGSSPSLQDAAMAAIADLLQAFENRLAEHLSKLADTETLGRLQDALQSIAQFRADFASHRDSFLPFLTNHLLGVAPNVLSAPKAHLDASLSLLDHFDDAAVEAAVGPLRTAAEQAVGALIDTLASFDPADPAAYVQLQLELQTVASAAQTLRDALLPFYHGLQALVDAHAWDLIFSTLAQLLNAITVQNPTAVRDVIDWLAGNFNELVGRLQTIFGPQDLAARIEAMNRAMRAAVQNSILGQVRQLLQDFLNRIREAIESVPTDQVQHTVNDMLSRVRQEIDSLNLTQIGTTIESRLQEAEQFIIANINQALRDQVRGALAGLLQNLRGLPIAAIETNLTNAVAQLQSLIAELETAIQGSLDQLNQFLSQLDTLSFRPVSEEVIGEINNVKQQLRAINPNALSDVEKLALRGALAVLQAIDLQGTVVISLKGEFHDAGGGLKSLLDDLTAVLDQLKQRLDAFQPQQLIGDLSGVLDSATQVADQLNATLLLGPLYQQLDGLAAEFQQISPGRILDPLQLPYQSVVSAVNQLEPTQLVAPLRQLYREIDRLIGYVDITPLLDELDRREKAMLVSVRQSLLAAFDNAQLPGFLGEFLAKLRPVIEEIGDALLASPDQELRRIGLEIPQRLKLTGVFEPLDRVFGELVAMIRSVPAAELTTAMNTIRESIGVALVGLNPRAIVDRFRAADALLSAISPHLLLSMPFELPALKLQFQASVEGAPAGQQGGIVATIARFDAAIAITSIETPQTTVSQLITAHRELQSSVRRRINSLEASAAEAAYAKLRDSLDQTLPEFLRRSQPLTYADVLSGFDTLRPSRQAQLLEDAMAEFLKKLEPLQAVLQPAIDGFFAAIRDTVNLLSPLAIKDSLAAVYDTLRQKVRILDPDTLASQLHSSIFDPVMASLTQFDPAQWRQRLNESFTRVIAALTGSVRAILDDIAAAIDEQLRAIRTQIRALTDQLRAVFAAVAAGLRTILDKVEHLVFVEILARLHRLLDNLAASFGLELDRVRAAFNEMLAAIPLGGGAQASASVGVG